MSRLSDELQFVVSVKPIKRHKRFGVRRSGAALAIRRLAAFRAERLAFPIAAPKKKAPEAKPQAPKREGPNRKAKGFPHGMRQAAVRRAVKFAGHRVAW